MEPNIRQRPMHGMDREGMDNLTYSSVRNTISSPLETYRKIGSLLSEINDDGGVNDNKDTGGDIPKRESISRRVSKSSVPQYRLEVDYSKTRKISSLPNALRDDPEFSELFEEDAIYEIPYISIVEQTQPDAASSGYSPQTASPIVRMEGASKGSGVVEAWKQLQHDDTFVGGGGGSKGASGEDIGEVEAMDPRSVIPSRRSSLLHHYQDPSAASTRRSSVFGQQIANGARGRVFADIGTAAATNDSTREGNVATALPSRYVSSFWSPEEEGVSSGEATDNAGKKSPELPKVSLETFNLLKNTYEKYNIVPPKDSLLYKPEFWRPLLGKGLTNWEGLDSILGATESEEESTPQVDESIAALPGVIMEGRGPFAKNAVDNIVDIFDSLQRQTQSLSSLSGSGRIAKDFRALKNRGPEYHDAESQLGSEAEEEIYWSALKASVEVNENVGETPSALDAYKEQHQGIDRRSGAPPFLGNNNVSETSGQAEIDSASDVTSERVFRAPPPTPEVIQGELYPEGQPIEIPLPPVQQQRTKAQQQQQQLQQGPSALGLQRSGAPSGPSGIISQAPGVVSRGDVTESTAAQPQRAVAEASSFSGEYSQIDENAPAPAAVSGTDKALPRTPSVTFGRTEYQGEPAVRGMQDHTPSGRDQGDQAEETIPPLHIRISDSPYVPAAIRLLQRHEVTPIDQFSLEKPKSRHRQIQQLQAETAPSQDMPGQEKWRQEVPVSGKVDLSKDSNTPYVGSDTDSQIAMLRFDIAELRNMVISLFDEIKDSQAFSKQGRARRWEENLDLGGDGGEVCSPFQEAPGEHLVNETNVSARQGYEQQLGSDTVDLVNGRYPLSVWDERYLERPFFVDMLFNQLHDTRYYLTSLLRAIEESVTRLVETEDMHYFEILQRVSQLEDTLQNALSATANVPVASVVRPSTVEMPASATDATERNIPMTSTLWSPQRTASATTGYPGKSVPQTTGYRPDEASAGLNTGLNADNLAGICASSEWSPTGAVASDAAFPSLSNIATQVVDSILVDHSIERELWAEEEGSSQAPGERDVHESVRQVHELPNVPVDIYADSDEERNRPKPGQNRSLSNQGVLNQLDSICASLPDVLAQRVRNQVLSQLYRQEDVDLHTTPNTTPLRSGDSSEWSTPQQQDSSMNLPSGGWNRPSTAASGKQEQIPGSKSHVRRQQDVDLHRIGSHGTISIEGTDKDSNNRTVGIQVSLPPVGERRGSFMAPLFPLSNSTGARKVSDAKDKHVTPYSTGTSKQSEVNPSSMNVQTAKQLPTQPSGQASRPNSEHKEQSAAEFRVPPKLANMLLSLQGETAQIRADLLNLQSGLSRFMNFDHADMEDKIADTVRKVGWLEEMSMLLYDKTRAIDREIYGDEELYAELFPEALQEARSDVPNATMVDASTQLSGLQSADLSGERPEKLLDSYSILQLNVGSEEEYQRLLDRLLQQQKTLRKDLESILLKKQGGEVPSQRIADLRTEGDVRIAPMHLQQEDRTAACASEPSSRSYTKHYPTNIPVSVRPFGVKKSSLTPPRPSGTGSGARQTAAEAGGVAEVPRVYSYPTTPERESTRGKTGTKGQIAGYGGVSEGAGDVGWGRDVVPSLSPPLQQELSRTSVTTTRTIGTSMVGDNEFQQDQQLYNTLADILYPYSSIFSSSDFTEPETVGSQLQIVSQLSQLDSGAQDLELSAAMKGESELLEEALANALARVSLLWNESQAKALEKQLSIDGGRESMWQSGDAPKWSVLRSQETGIPTAVSYDPWNAPVQEIWDKQQGQRSLPAQFSARNAAKKPPPQEGKIVPPTLSRESESMVLLDDLNTHKVPLSSDTWDEQKRRAEKWAQILPTESPTLDEGAIRLQLTGDDELDAAWVKFLVENKENIPDFDSLFRTPDGQIRLQQMREDFDTKQRMQLIAQTSVGSTKRRSRIVQDVLRDWQRISPRIQSEGTISQAYGDSAGIGRNADVEGDTYVTVFPTDVGYALEQLSPDLRSIPSRYAAPLYVASSESDHSRRRESLEGHMVFDVLPETTVDSNVLGADSRGVRETGLGALLHSELEERLAPSQRVRMAPSGRGQMQQRQDIESVNLQEGTRSIARKGLLLETLTVEDIQTLVQLMESDDALFEEVQDILLENANVKIPVDVNSVMDLPEGTVSPREVLGKDLLLIIHDLLMERWVQRSKEQGFDASSIAGDQPSIASIPGARHEADALPAPQSLPEENIFALYEQWTDPHGTKAPEVVYQITTPITEATDERIAGNGTQDGRESSEKASNIAWDGQFTQHEDETTTALEKEIRNLHSYADSLAEVLRLRKQMQERRENVQSGRGLQSEGLATKEAEDEPVGWPVNAPVDKGSYGVKLSDRMTDSLRPTLDVAEADDGGSDMDALGKTLISAMDTLLSTKSGSKFLAQSLESLDSSSPTFSSSLFGNLFLQYLQGQGLDSIRRQLHTRKKPLSKKKKVDFGTPLQYEGAYQSLAEFEDAQRQESRKRRTSYPRVEAQHPPKHRRTESSVRRSEAGTHWGSVDAKGSHDWIQYGFGATEYPSRNLRDDETSAASTRGRANAKRAVERPSTARITELKDEGDDVNQERSFNNTEGSYLRNLAEVWSNIGNLFSRKRGSTRSWTSGAISRVAAKAKQHSPHQGRAKASGVKIKKGKDKKLSPAMGQPKATSVSHTSSPSLQTSGDLPKDHPSRSIETNVLQGSFPLRTESRKQDDLQRPLRREEHVIAFVDDKQILPNSWNKESSQELQDNDLYDRLWHSYLAGTLFPETGYSKYNDAATGALPSSHGPSSPKYAVLSSQQTQVPLQVPVSPLKSVRFSAAAELLPVGGWHHRQDTQSSGISALSTTLSTPTVLLQAHEQTLPQEHDVTIGEPTLHPPFSTADLLIQQQERATSERAPAPSGMDRVLAPEDTTKFTKEYYPSPTGARLKVLVYPRNYSDEVVDESPLAALVDPKKVGLGKGPWRRAGGLATQKASNVASYATQRPMLARGEQESSRQTYTSMAGTASSETGADTLETAMRKVDAAMELVKKVQQRREGGASAQGMTRGTSGFQPTYLIARMGDESKGNKVPYEPPQQRFQTSGETIPALSVYSAFISGSQTRGDFPFPEAGSSYPTVNILAGNSKPSRQSLSQISTGVGGPTKSDGAILSPMTSSAYVPFTSPGKTNIAEKAYDPYYSFQKLEPNCEALPARIEKGQTSSELYNEGERPRSEYSRFQYSRFVPRGRDPISWGAQHLVAPSISLGASARWTGQATGEERHKRLSEIIERGKHSSYDVSQDIVTRIMQASGQQHQEAVSTGSSQNAKDLTETPNVPGLLDKRIERMERRVQSDLANVLHVGPKAPILHEAVLNNGPYPPRVVLDKVREKAAKKSGYPSTIGQKMVRITSIPSIVEGMESVVVPSTKSGTTGRKDQDLPQAISSTRDSFSPLHIYNLSQKSKSYGTFARQKGYSNLYPVAPTQQERAQDEGVDTKSTLQGLREKTAKPVRSLSIDQDYEFQLLSETDSSDLNIPQSTESPIGTNESNEEEEATTRERDAIAKAIMHSPPVFKPNKRQPSSIDESDTPGDGLEERRKMGLLDRNRIREALSLKPTANDSKYKSIVPSKLKSVYTAASPYSTESKEISEALTGATEMTPMESWQDLYLEGKQIIPTGIDSSYEHFEDFAGQNSPNTKFIYATADYQEEAIPVPIPGVNIPKPYESSRSSQSKRLRRKIRKTGKKKATERKLKAEQVNKVKTDYEMDESDTRGLWRLTESQKETSSASHQSPLATSASASAQVSNLFSMPSRSRMSPVSSGTASKPHAKAGDSRMELEAAAKPQYHSSGPLHSTKQIVSELDVAPCHHPLTEAQSIPVGDIGPPVSTSGRQHSTYSRYSGSSSTTQR